MSHKSALARNLQTLGKTLNALAELRRPRSLKDRLERRLGHRKSAEDVVAGDVKQLADDIQLVVRNAGTTVARHPLAKIVGLVVGVAAVRMLSRRN